MQSYLVVGAGFAGAVYARILAEGGHQVQVIDRRGHIAGNAYDFVDDNGVRVHRYGPHLFHTKNDDVVKWLSTFTDWEPYQHRVKAILPSGVRTPLPVNRRTINDVFGTQLSTSSEVEAFLKLQSENIAKPRNAAEYLYKNIGRTLTDLFFRPYTKKMWDLDLEDMSDSVVRRIPIRTDDEDRYFPDATFQLMPKMGIHVFLSGYSATRTSRFLSASLSPRKWRFFMIMYSTAWQSMSISIAGSVRCHTDQ